MGTGRVNVVDLLDRVTGSMNVPLPDECPVCHQGIGPLITHALTIGDDRCKSQLPLTCSRNECQSVFIATYRRISITEEFELEKTEPIYPQIPQYPDSIDRVSGRFCSIYKHANHADQQDLDEIVGCGYRKALEFLVKDFAIYQNPDDEDNIREQNLRPCIENYIDSEKIKRAARMTSLLGNDQTHYEQLYEDTDIDDLRRLLRLTIQFIDQELELERFESRMSEGQS